MAIERQDQVPEQPLTVEEREFVQEVEAIQDSLEQDFVMMEDGSAVAEDSLMVVQTIEFDGNLAEALSEDDLNKIASSLVDGIDAIVTGKLE